MFESDFKRREKIYTFPFVCTHLDESSAALLEETKHPANGQNNGGCHDDVKTNTPPTLSVGEVYDKVNEEFIKRMNDLEKSIEETLQQKMMIKRQTMLQEYWTKIQVSLNINKPTVWSSSMLSNRLG